MKDIIIGSLGSLLVCIILFFFSTFISRKAKKLFIGILSKLLDIDIEFVFRNKESSSNDVKYEINKAKWVKIFTGRGNELQREAFLDVFNKNIKTKILLPNDSVNNANFNFLTQREIELSKFDKNFGAGLLITQVQAIYAYLDTYIKEEKVELRKFNVPCIGRIVITDRCLFYTPYTDNAYSRDCKVYLIRKNDALYDNFDRFFEQVWESSI
jgi:hypothetical protein